MRIVYLLLHDFRFASIGPEEFARRRYHFSKEYARRMASLGHDVKLYILSTRSSPRQVFDVDGYEIKAFPASILFPPLQRFGNAHSLDALRELDRDAPDLVHIHNYYLWNFPYLAPWAKRRGRRLVAQYHGSDPIRGAKARGFCPSLRLCDRLLVPLLSEVNLLRHALRLGGERVVRFPSTGVDIGRFHRVARRADGLVLFYAGRVPAPASYRWEKSPQYLIPMVQALAALGKRPRLVVAGDGPGLEAMKKSARNSGIDNLVDFLGQVDHAELPELYSRATLTMIPFQTEEIGPYWDGALQESLACGTPVAAFNDASSGQQKYGTLIPTEPKSAARLISKAAEDVRWLAAVEEEGPRAIRDRCEWSTMTHQLESTYLCLDGRGA